MPALALPITTWLTTAAFTIGTIAISYGTVITFAAAAAFGACQAAKDRTQ